MIVDPNRGDRARITKMMRALGYSHSFENFHVTGEGDSDCKGWVLHYHRG